MQAVIEKVKHEFDKNCKVEGQSSDGWLVADFGDVVVHLFSPDQRDYYRLENLWDEGKTLLHLQ